jgi:hypothetical protein
VEEEAHRLVAGREHREWLAAADVSGLEVVEIGSQLEAYVFERPHRVERVTPRIDQAGALLRDREASRAPVRRIDWWWYGQLRLAPDDVLTSPPGRLSKNSMSAWFSSSRSSCWLAPRFHSSSA